MNKRQYNAPENYLEARIVLGERVEDALHEIMRVMSKTVLGTMAPLMVLDAAFQLSGRMLVHRVAIEERRHKERKIRNANG